MNFGQQDQKAIDEFHARAAEKAAAEKAAGLPSVLAVARALKALTGDAEVFGVRVVVAGAGRDRLYAVAGGEPAASLSAARHVIDAIGGER